MVSLKKTTIVSLLPLLVATGCKLDSKDPDFKDHNIVIEWTSYGVPHIKAENFTDLGAGLGYVLAQDRLCNYAERFVTVSSERAKVFGAGEENKNVNTDFAYLHLGLDKQANNNFSALDERNQHLMKGFAKGYNRWLDENKALPQECANYVTNINHIDVYKLNLSLNYWGFIENYFEELATAQPNANISINSLLSKPLEQYEKFKGSNGWALGRDLTQSGKGLILSNTHLPHTPKYAWYEAQLTIRDKIDVYGGFLPGFITPALGFNNTFAWTHTWSASRPGSLYLLTQDDENSLSYQYDNSTKPLVANTYTIEVLDDDNQLSTIERTLYTSHYGPIVAFNNDGTMVAAKDASSQSSNQADYWLKLATSKDVPSAISLNEQGYKTGSQNIMMTDSNGDTFYADLASIPDLSDEAWQIISEHPVLSEERGVLLDGSNSVFEWSQTTPYAKVPKRSSTSYVQNANEAAWLVNLEAPLTEYLPLYGAINYPQSPRTRLSVELLESFKDNKSKVTLADVQQVMFDQRLFLAEKIVDDLVLRCQAHPLVYLSVIEQTIDTSEACSVLTQWDKKANLDSVGTHIFREYAYVVHEALLFNDCNGESCWRVPFSAENPINTPYGLKDAVNLDEDIHLQALAYATMVINNAGISLTAKLSELQSLVKEERSFPISGGYGDITGSFSTIGVTPSKSKNYFSFAGLESTGYSINTGDGFIFLSEFTDTGVKGKSMLLYSQSNLKTSSHYFDQAAMLANEEYKTIAFTRSEIKADKNYQKEKLEIK